MKKRLLYAMVCLSGAAYAQNVVEPLILPEFYAGAISQDGKWITSDTGMEETVVYNIETNGHHVYPQISVGNGNVFSADGTAVGSTMQDQGVLLKDGAVTYIKSLKDKGLSMLNGISFDGSCIVGVMSSPDLVPGEDNQSYVPVILELGEDGEYGEPVILPHPDKDLFGSVPQYSSATWVSNDGKVVLGQVIDYSGMFLYPIVYRQDESGEWTYTLPTESTFNPDKLPLPEFPGEFNISPVEPTDFMSPEKKAEYEEDLVWWATPAPDGGGYDNELWPGNHLEDYMTQEQIDAYNKAVDEYNEKAQEYNEEIMYYYEIRDLVINSSVHFVQNGSTLNAEGTIAAAASISYVDNGTPFPEERYTTYVLNLADNTFKAIDSQYTNLIPGQVLDGGIIMASSPATGLPLSYVLTPGAADYVPLEDYLATCNPGAVSWMKDNLYKNVVVAVDPETFEPTYADTMMTGHALASNDFSVVAGGVMAYMFSETDTYLTYVFTGLSSGVENVSAADGSVLKVLRGGVVEISGEVSDLEVVDLSGRVVFSVDNASGTLNTNLGRGIYVVTYTDAEGNKIAGKYSF